jgi:pimeloyl-ACP methyl ester carboxylesterase
MRELPYGLPADLGKLGPWRVVTAAGQHERFIEDVPAESPPVLNENNFEAWATAYLASDPTSASRNPPSVNVPNGPAADVIEAWTGRLAYTPVKIKAPLLIVRGEWDSLSNDEDAVWLMNNASASIQRRDIKLPRGTHLMLLEDGCDALHQASIEFLSER